MKRKAAGIGITVVVLDRKALVLAALPGQGGRAAGGAAPWDGDIPISSSQAGLHRG